MHENEIGSVVVDCAVTLHQELGPGLLETVYEATLARAMERRGLSVQRQIAVPIEYEGETFAEGFRADLIVDDVVVEVKATQNPPTEAALKQLRKYVLAFSKTERQLFSGLVVNFNQSTGRTDVREVLSSAAPPSRTTRSAVRSGAFLRSLHSSRE